MKPSGEHHDVRGMAEALLPTIELERRKADPPIAGCTRCHEPLVCTFEFSGAEFYCQCCGATFGFLSPMRLDWTEERQARHDELKAQYDIERCERDPVIRMVYAIRFVDNWLGQEHRKIRVSR